MIYGLLYVLPKNIISSTFGLLAQMKKPRFFIQWSIQKFSKYYKIKMDEAEKGIEDYQSLNDFFTRKLKNGLRPLSPGVVHPADSVLTQNGRLFNGSLVQAKGKNYLLSHFLRDDELSEKLKDGYFFTYYLCPTDYHRVHAPVSGSISKVQYIPGMLWPVNSWSVNTIKDLFVVNERVVVTLETNQGVCALVLVGATNVGKITLSFEPKVCTNSFWNRCPIIKNYLPNSIQIKKGDEIGMFQMGSTVIMVYEKSFFEGNSNFASGSVKVGGSLLV